MQTDAVSKITQSGVRLPTKSNGCATRYDEAMVEHELHEKIGARGGRLPEF